MRNLVLNFQPFLSIFIEKKRWSSGYRSTVNVPTFDGIKSLKDFNAYK